MSLPREICEWVAKNPDKLEPDFSKTGGYQTRRADRCRDAAHFVQQFTVGAIRKAFRISRSDVEENSEPGTIAFRVRTLTKIIEDDTLPAAARLEADKTLWEIVCCGALSHEHMDLGESMNKPPSGGSGLNGSFRDLHFGIRQESHTASPE